MNYGPTKYCLQIFKVHVWIVFDDFIVKLASVGSPVSSQRLATLMGTQCHLNPLLRVWRDVQHKEYVKSLDTKARAEHAALDDEQTGIGFKSVGKYTDSLH